MSFKKKKKVIKNNYYKIYTFFTFSYKMQMMLSHQFLLMPRYGCFGGVAFMTSFNPHKENWMSYFLYVA